MTETMIKYEVERKIFPTRELDALLCAKYEESQNGVVFKVQESRPTAAERLNFNSGGMAQHVANTIMAESDREVARERNKCLKAVGKSKSERVLAISKRMTAGKLVIDGGSFHLNKDVLDQAENREKKRDEAERDARRKEDFKYLCHCHLADLALIKNTSPDPSKWRTSSDLVDYLRPLRLKEDPAMPTKRSDLELRFLQWNHRTRKQIVPELEVYLSFQSWLGEENKKPKRQSKSRGRKKNNQGNNSKPNSDLK